MALAAGHEVHIALDGMVRRQAPEGREAAVDPSGLTWPTPSAVHAATAAAWRDHRIAAEAAEAAEADNSGPKNLSDILESFFKVKQIVALNSGLPLNGSEAEDAKREEVEQEEEAGRIDLLYAAIVALIVIVAVAYYYKMHQSGKQDESSAVPQPGESAVSK